MRKALIVARTEFGEAIRKKSFLVGILLLPAMMTGSILIQIFANRADTRPRAFAVVDHTGGQLYPIIERAAADWNAAVGRAGEKAKLARFEPLLATTADPLALSDRIRRDELYAFVEVPADVLEPGGAPLAYHSDNPNYDDLREWLAATLGNAVRDRRLRDAGLDPVEVGRLSVSLRAKNLGLFERGPDGRLIAAEPVDKVRTFAVPAALMFIVFFVITTSTPALLYGVIEEKMSRVSEVMLGSIAPFELMMGKILCGVAVALVMASIYVGGAYFAAWYYGYADAVPTWLLGTTLLFIVLAVFLYGSIYTAIGSACSELKDAQSLTAPVMLLSMVPAFVWLPVVLSPSSPLAVGLSLFPPATPCLMTLRMALHPAPPPWQVALSVALTGGMALACVWAAGRIFRTGLLMQGKPPTFRELARWITIR